MLRVVLALGLALAACKKEKAAPPPTPAPDPQVSIDAAPAIAVDAGETPDAVSPDDAGVLDALSSKGTSTCASTECYMPAEKACYVPAPNQGICGKPGAVCRRCKPRE